ncbi:hypothetical protein GDO81_022507 [Engystomops pustulosus]|uniref:Uncharacterized protein n=1 Tax=Engystomops pustulosus TaxID=76066 RepID=A0AAV6YM38_ENGPU|nr:hypothetical protein GDO81_022507 [Engystomops pustulosus]
MPYPRAVNKQTWLFLPLSWTGMKSGYAMGASEPAFELEKTGCNFSVEQTNISWGTFSCFIYSVLTTCLNCVNQCI